MDAVNSPSVPRDKTWFLLVEGTKIVKTLVIGGLVLAGLWLLRPLVETVAGRAPIFQFNVGLTVSVVINIVLVSLVLVHRSRLNSYRERLRAAESRSR